MEPAPAILAGAGFAFQSFSAALFFCIFEFACDIDYLLEAMHKLRVIFFSCEDKVDGYLE